MTHYPALADAMAYKRANPNPAHNVDVTANFFDNGQTPHQAAARAKFNAHQKSIKSTSHAINSFSETYANLAIKLLTFLKAQAPNQFQPSELIKKQILSRGQMGGMIKKLQAANLIQKTGIYSDIHYFYKPQSLEIMQSYITNKFEAE